MTDLFPDDQRAKKARIEIIPLIDVVFFLLATFVLFTLSLEHLGAFDITLPKSGTPPEVDSTFYIKAMGKSMYSCREGASGDERTVSPAELKTMLSDYRVRVSPARVVVRGANDVSFGSTVDVLDAVHAAGIEQVALDTSPETPR